MSRHAAALSNNHECTCVKDLQSWLDAQVQSLLDNSPHLRFGAKGHENVPWEAIFDPAERAPSNAWPAVHHLQSTGRRLKQSEPVFAG